MIEAKLNILTIKTDTGKVKALLLDDLEVLIAQIEDESNSFYERWKLLKQMLEE